MPAKKKTTKKKTANKKPVSKKKPSVKKKPVKKPAAKKRVAPKRPAKKSASTKKATSAAKTSSAAKPTRTTSSASREPRERSLAPGKLSIPRGLGADAGGQSGDLQGLSRRRGPDSESVEELLEEGNAFEADVVAGVEDAGADEKPVRTHQVPEDDVPEEYLDGDN